MSYTLSGTVAGPSGFLNGAAVYAYDIALFTTGGVVNAPVAGQAPPTTGVITSGPGQNVFGPVTTGTIFGGPGQWELTVANAVNYFIGVAYPPNSTNAQWYWTLDESLTQIKGDTGTQGPQGVTGAQGLTGHKV